MNYREILTKAIIAKGKKNISQEYTLETEESANTVLGCWVINNSFQGTSVKDQVIVNGNFDVNVWYSYDNDSKTAVSTKKFNYTDTMRISALNNSNENHEVVVKSLKQPTVSDVSIKDGVIHLKIDKELGVEVMGDTKVRVPVEDVLDNYEVIDEETSEEVEKIDTEYLK